MARTMRSQWQIACPPLLQRRRQRRMIDYLNARAMHLDDNSTDGDLGADDRRVASAYRVVVADIERSHSSSGRGRR